MDSDWLPCFTIFLKGLETELLQEKLYIQIIDDYTVLEISRHQHGSSPAGSELEVLAKIKQWEWERWDVIMVWDDVASIWTQKKIATKNLGPRWWFLFSSLSNWKWSNLTIIFFFEVGWFNHQLETCDLSYQFGVRFWWTSCHLLQSLSQPPVTWAEPVLRCLMVNYMCRIAWITWISTNHLTSELKEFRSLWHILQKVSFQAIKLPWRETTSLAHLACIAWHHQTSQDFQSWIPQWSHHAVGVRCAWDSARRLSFDTHEWFRYFWIELRDKRHEVN